MNNEGVPFGRALRRVLFGIGRTGATAQTQDSVAVDEKVAEQPQDEIDSIAFHPGSFGADYPDGLFVVRNGMNVPDAQRFKLVSWSDVRRALGH